MVDSGGLSGRPELARTLSVQEHTRQLQAEAEERAEQQHGVYSARMNNLATLNVDEIEKVSSSSGFDRVMEQVEKIKADIKAQAQRVPAPIIRPPPHHHLSPPTCATRGTVSNHT
jgi:hypothetical protein